MSGKVGGRNHLGESSYFVISKGGNKENADGAHDTSMVMVESKKFKYT
jgi:hypothetical protein